MKLTSIKPNRDIQVRELSDGEFECIISESTYHVAVRVTGEALEAEPGRIASDLDTRLDYFMGNYILDYRRGVMYH